MRSHRSSTVVRCCLTLAAVLLAGGCAHRGYIVASVQTVIGLDVSENPQTQVPHVRFGYVRNQFYYVPTGKSEGDAPGGPASDTPELVSDLDVDMKFLDSTRIREKFAIGAVAVGGAPATAMFSEGRPVVTVVAGSEINPLVQAIGAEIQKPGQEAKAKEWITKTYPNDPNKNDVDKFLDHPPAPAVDTLAKLLKHLRSK